MINYLSLLGWSPGEDREIMDPEEIARELDLDRIGTSNTVFDVEKMKWVSGQHIAAMGLAELTSAVEPYVDRTRFALQGEQLSLAVDAVRSRLQTFGDIGVALELLFPDESMLASAATELAAVPEGSLPLLEAVQSAIRTLDPWTAEAASSAVRRAGSELGLKGPKLFHPIRLALCGTTSGPDLGKVIAALGQREVLGRLERARSAVAGRT